MKYQLGARKMCRNKEAGEVAKAAGKQREIERVTTRGCCNWKMRIGEPANLPLESLIYSRASILGEILFQPRRRTGVDTDRNAPASRARLFI